MANALESASLVMIPSGYEDGTLGSLKPTDGTGDFTFTRGSNLSATRVNASGYIEKGYENLLEQSNTFSDAAWADLYTSYTRTGGQAGYDGSNDAWELSKASASNGYITQSSAIAGSVHTFSIYAKSGSQNGLTMFFGTPVLSVNLDTGNTFGFNRSVIDSSITSVGNDWWKIEFTFLATGQGISFKVMDADADTNAAGSIYIQDAMLNQGLVAYPYLETTTAPVSGGILEDMPRLDYSGSCPALLLEPSRTNAISNSEYVQGPNFSIGDFISSPEGVANGVGFIPSTANTTHYISTSAVGLTIANSSVVFSFYVKEGTQPYLRGRFDENSFTKRCFFGIDLTDNSVVKSGTGASNVEITFENSIDGWKRVVFTATYDATPTGNGIAIFLGSGDSMGTDFDVYAGDGSTFFHIYGLQCEQGSYPTSYIPTYGVSQTRLRDSAAELSNDIISGATEFTWLFDNTGTELDGQINVVFQLVCTGTALRYYSSQGGRFYAGGYFGEADAVGKLCVKYDGTTITMFKDGVKSTSTSSTNLGTTIYLDELFTSNNLGTPIKLNQMLFFKTALSDDECIELTTI